MAHVERAAIAPLLPLRAEPAATSFSRARSPVRLLLRNRLTVAGLGMVLIFVVLAVAAPLFTPYDPADVNPARRLEIPSLEHPLGLDNLGRDIVSRLLFGSRWSLGTAGSRAVSPVL